MIFGIAWFLHYYESNHFPISQMKKVSWGQKHYATKDNKANLFFRQTTDKLHNGRRLFFRECVEHISEFRLVYFDLIIAVFRPCFL